MYEDDIQPTQEPEPVQEQKPDPTESLRSELESVKQQNYQTQQLLMAAIQGGYGSAQQQTGSYSSAQPAPLDDDSDLDEDQRKLLSKAEQRILAKLEDRERQLRAEYSSANQQHNVRWAMEEKRRIAQELSAMGMRDVEKDIDKYLTDNRVPPDYLAQAGAFETITATVLGRRMLEEARRNAGRSPNLSSSSGRPSVGRGQEEPLVSNEQLDMLRRNGVDIDAGELEFLIQSEQRNQYGTSATDYEAFLQKKRG